MWIIKEDVSMEIIGCNIHHKENNYELWVTRTNGKNYKLFENESLDEVNLYKEAIDYAIENKETALRL